MLRGADRCLCEAALDDNIAAMKHVSMVGSIVRRPAKKTTSMQTRYAIVVVKRSDSLYARANTHAIRKTPKHTLSLLHYHHVFFRGDYLENKGTTHTYSSACGKYLIGILQ